MTSLAPLPRQRAKRIVYIGTPEIAVAPLRELVAAGFEVELVVTVPALPQLDDIPSPGQRVAASLESVVVELSARSAVSRRHE